MPFLIQRTAYLNMSKRFEDYLNKQNYDSNLIKDEPHNDLQLAVIIPAYNEPNILHTLNSLTNCSPAPFPIEVLILINHSEVAEPNIVEQNNKTFIEVNKWISSNSTSHLRFHCIFKDDLPEKHAGAGLARKIAMDETIRRFNAIENEAGIIASLDADTLVSQNYLTEIQKAFYQNKKLNCFTFNFEHNRDDSLSEENLNAIILYELYLRYFKQALKYTGFPYAYHTIGSCFAVKAEAYVKQGGMNRKQAGEDFYFLHKIFPLGGIQELNQVTVYPSSRISDRVPFGTGPALKKIIEEGNFLSYQPEFFEHIKVFFSSINSLFNCKKNELEQFHQSLHPTLQNFISVDEFALRILEINTNSTNLKTFNQRFFNWFDALKIIKYLNFVHSSSRRISLQKAVVTFLSFENIIVSELNPRDLLELMRKRELN
ncbi:MAG: glycosyltransferase [Salinivirgaceae bacterium]|jgi:cellulose synthase/poly-beta-1,6-N-acetylglucosamine synthase-like glycosyltransferase|nr:glycosyltransferase [Salinivirgaceae bacterium]